MFITAYKKYANNNSGQALLFVVVLMTIALAVGVNVSLRTLGSSARTSQSDSYLRAVAAAEGGLERFLSLTPQQLNDAKNGNCPHGLSYVNNKCKVEFNAAANATDQINSYAEVTVTDFSTNTTDNRLQYDLNPYETVEINLNGYNPNPNTINLCWNGNDNLQTMSYNNNRQTVKDLLICNNAGGCNFTSGAEFEGGSTASDQPYPSGFLACKNLSLVSGTKVGLRIKAIGGKGTTISLAPTGGASLPTQGFKITSNGFVKNVAGSATALNVNSTQIAYISRPFLKEVFDFVLYTNSPINLQD